jgi:hypothetical protein
MNIATARLPAEPVPNSVRVGVDDYFRPVEITPICDDFLVADAVLRNQSPYAEFPANREKNREFQFFAPLLPGAGRNSGFKSVSYDRIP